MKNILFVEYIWLAQKREALVKYSEENKKDARVENPAKVKNELRVEKKAVCSKKMIKLNIKEANVRG